MRSSINRLAQFNGKLVEHMRPMPVSKRSSEEELNFRNKCESCPWILNRHQMSHLAEHPLYYNAWAGSYLEMLCLQRFWIYASKFVPRSVAPSTLTFIGLALNMLSSGLAMWYSPDFRQELPSWLLLVIGIGVFSYQTLDALDGKQAYKVQNTAIEELSDHGCDAISTVLLCVTGSIILQLGSYGTIGYMQMLLLFITSMVAFYCTHYNAHITRTMVFGRIDVSEAQFATIIICLLTCYFGQSIWLLPVNLGNFHASSGQILATAVMASFVMSTYKSLAMSVLEQRTPLELIGIEIPRRDAAARYNPLYSLCLMTGLLLMTYAPYEHAQLLYLITFGAAFAKLTIVLVVVNMTNSSQCPVFDSCMLPVTLLWLNNGFLRVTSPYTALLCAIITGAIDLIRYLTYVFWDVKHALNLNVFSVKNPGAQVEVKGYYVNGLNNEKILQDWLIFNRKHPNFFKELYNGNH